jgi:hypothetical protein
MRNKRLILALTGAVLCGLISGDVSDAATSRTSNQFTKDLNNVVVRKSRNTPGSEDHRRASWHLAPIPNRLGSGRRISQTRGGESAELRLPPSAYANRLTNLKLAPGGRRCRDASCDP